MRALAEAAGLALLTLPVEAEPAAELLALALAEADALAPVVPAPVVPVPVVPVVPVPVVPVPVDVLPVVELPVVELPLVEPAAPPTPAHGATAPEVVEPGVI